MLNKIIILLFLIFNQNLFSQRKAVNNYYINKTLSNSNHDKNLNEDNISSEKRNKYLVVITLKNYPLGKVAHKEKNIFINKVISQLRQLDRKIKSVEIVGWADSKANKGIEKQKLSISSRCLKSIKSEKVYDLDLAKLRACDLNYRLSLIIRQKKYLINHSTTLSFEDMPDAKKGSHEEIHGNPNYRKTEVKINLL